MPTTMKKALYWLGIAVFFLIYLTIALLVTDNLGLSIILAILLIYAFSTAHKVRNIQNAFVTGLPPAFQELDNINNHQAQEIESLKEQVESLEEQVKALEDRIEELQPPIYHHEEPL